MVPMKFETEVREIILRVPGVKSFRLPRPSGFAYKPGQWLIVTLRSEGEEITKHLTISSSPTETGHIEFTKKLTGSRFSKALDTLSAGSWARINAPFGKFTFEGEHRKVGMLTGGIGVTPMRSMIKYCTDVRSESEITLLYSCQSSSERVFMEDFQAMQKVNPRLKVVLTVTGSPGNWTGGTGRIDAAMVRREITDYIERVFFISGPQAMVEAMVSVLKGLGVPSGSIKTELFTGYPA